MILVIGIGNKIMELTESIESINSQLIEHFGIDTVTGQAIWRVVWSDDQYEMRLTDCSDAGITLLRPEVRLLPKYKQWIQHKYILERLVIVPEINIPELPATKVSYENLYTFEDINGDYLPPKFIAAKFVIDTVYAAQYSNHNLRKYVDDESSQEASLELKAKRVDEIVEALWGEQSEFHDGIHSKETVMIGGKEFKDDVAKLETKLFLAKKN